MRNMYAYVLVTEPERNIWEDYTLHEKVQGTRKCPPTLLFRFSFARKICTFFYLYLYVSVETEMNFIGEQNFSLVTNSKFR